MTIINATPHPIRVVHDVEAGLDTTFPVSGILPRVSTIEAEAEAIDGIPCVSQTLGDVEGLPASVAGTVFIVSAMVLNASDRADLVAPDTGPTCIRDEQGRILAVTRFIRR